MSSPSVVQSDSASLNAESAPPLSRPGTYVRGPQLRRAMGFVTVAWMFGAVWANIIAGTPITRFAENLHASEFQFGLLAALPFLASLISMPASLLIERTGARKLIFLITCYAQRLMWIPIALVPIWFLHRGGASAMRWAMYSFLILIFLMYAIGNVGGPAWTSWMADLIPPRLRGKYFSRRRQWAILTSIPAACGVGLLMGHFQGANSTIILWLCALLFIVSSIFGTADIALAGIVPDIPRAPKHDGGGWDAFAKTLKNRQFVWFGLFVATLTFAVSFMGSFVNLYLIEHIRLGDASTQVITLVAPLLAQLFILPFWGQAADRMGKKPVLAIASLGLVPVGLGWCLMGEGGAWLGFILSALGGLLWAGVEVANLNLVLEFSITPTDGEEGGSEYIAVNAIVINIAGCLGGLASGIIAQSLRDWHWHPIAGFKTFTFYDVLFALSGLLRLAAVVLFLPHIVEPTAHPTRTALRFMSSNIYNNLFNAILQPLRFLRLYR